MLKVIDLSGVGLTPSQVRVIDQARGTQDEMLAVDFKVLKRVAKCANRCIHKRITNSREER